MCDNTKCINQSNLCDGTTDCTDRSDESAEVCGIKVTCSDSFFHCKSKKDGTSGECIKHSFRCDGKVDCYDGSDEIDCPLIPVCEGFTCFSGQCLLSSLVCNGINDCDLGEDEKDCKFECKNGLFRYMFVYTWRSNCVSQGHIFHLPLSYDEFLPFIFITFLIPRISNFIRCCLIHSS